jgi:hypothetical protein
MRTHFFPKKAGTQVIWMKERVSYTLLRSPPLKLAFQIPVPVKTLGGENRNNNEA